MILVDSPAMRCGGKGTTGAIFALLVANVVGIGTVLGSSAAAFAAPRPNVLLISVDTLRADRMSSYGYSRRTSPQIDGLLETGVRFSRARTVEPLTAPALATMLTSLDPQEHGCTRNGLSVRSDVVSLPKLLRRNGYKAAAFVGNWTLRDRLWGMADHFDVFEEVMTQARWFGMVKREATAADLTSLSGEWLKDQVDEEPDRPFLLWVHYVEPHAPYKLQRDFLAQLGADPGGDIYSQSGKYDSEIAYVDHYIGRLLDQVETLSPARNTITIFVSDHGENLGEHGYWGHGRHLWEEGLHIPMGLAWPGRIDPAVEDAPALISDLAPTVLGLLDLEAPDFMRGQDWSPVFRGDQTSPMDRVTYYQAHKGVVSAKEDNTEVRQKGLLEVARIDGANKEVLRVPKGRRWVFDLESDPAEQSSQVPLDSPITEALEEWLATVKSGLEQTDDLPAVAMSDEDRDALRALGYID